MIGVVPMASAIEAIEEHFKIEMDAGVMENTCT